MLQVVFHSNLAEEEDLFDLKSVINRECEKMIRRHPHIFLEERANNDIKSIDKVLDCLLYTSTHPVLSGPAIQRLRDSAIEELVLLNTVPMPEEKKLDKMTFLSVAPLFAEAMTRVFTNGSISVLFD